MSVRWRRADELCADQPRADQGSAAQPHAARRPRADQLAAERPAPAPPSAPSFGAFVAAASAAGHLVVQPRMGFSDPAVMRLGLQRTKYAAARAVGTITLDSYTRLGEHAAARRALAAGDRLNGYPIVDHRLQDTRAMLDGIVDATFPVQVRHGSARPERIIRAVAAAGLDATEGGPVSYCLPYGRTPLSESIDCWARSCELLADLVPPPRLPHVETFGGCLLGQLCPPGLLVALSLLEGLFFTQHGIASVSLSYAQQTDPVQDEHAIRALRRLAAEFLPPEVDLHVVVYTYMGVFPASDRGARRLLEESARLAVRAGAQRLIVKTAAESRRIPTIEENVRALEWAGATAAAEAGPVPAPARPVDGDAGRDDPDDAHAVYDEARAFVEAVLDLDADVGRALLAAFGRGYLDVPYCLHPDNAGRSRSTLDGGGRLRWSAVGAMPVRPARIPGPGRPEMSSDQLLKALRAVADKFDH
ncbi:methylaspartate mutase epsilon subunit [Catenulispora sp. GAS73]|uniref:methylaspartate mutase n=1 Tax=Catenulispora sp. GAS73 TaxID=3156269 RepID=UPI003513FA8C